MAESSIVRNNLLTLRGYTPYCGGQWCDQGTPRTVFAGEQFACRCGWRSTFEPEFIERYKAAQANLRAIFDGAASTSTASSEGGNSDA